MTRILLFSFLLACQVRGVTPAQKDSLLSASISADSTAWKWVTPLEIKKHDDFGSDRNITFSNVFTLDRETEIKLLAYFSVNAPEIPLEHDPHIMCTEFSMSNGKSSDCSPMIPSMSLEKWRATYAKKQLDEFEKMWNDLNINSEKK